MPGTAVASRQASWARMKTRYKKHSSGWYARKEARKLDKARKMAHNRAMGARK